MPENCPPSHPTPLFTLHSLLPLGSGVGWAGCRVAVKCGCGLPLLFHAGPSQEGAVCSSATSSTSPTSLIGIGDGSRSPRGQWAGLSGAHCSGLQLGTSLCAPASVDSGAELCRGFLCSHPGEGVWDSEWQQQMIRAIALTKSISKENIKTH